MIVRGVDAFGEKVSIEIPARKAMIRFEGKCDDLRGDIDGLYGRMPPELQKLVRKIMDAPNYDFGAMELLDALHMEWRKDV